MSPTTSIAAAVLARLGGAATASDAMTSSAPQKAMDKRYGEGAGAAQGDGQGDAWTYVPKGACTSIKISKGYGALTPRSA